MHLTQTSLHHVVDDKLENINKGACLLDISECFDSINHTILLKKLEVYGITSSELKWFSGNLMLGLHRIATNLGPIYELKDFGVLRFMGSKQKVYNWPSNKSDFWPHQDRNASSPRSHAIRKSISINSAPEPHPRPDRRDTLATDLWRTCDALQPISYHPTTWARPHGVTCVTRQKFAWVKKFKSDLRQIYDRAEWHTRPSSELWPICKDLWPKEDPAASWVTRKWNWHIPRRFFDSLKRSWSLSISIAGRPGLLRIFRSNLWHSGE